MAVPARSRKILGLAIAAAGLLALILGGLGAADLRSRLGPTRLLIGPSVIVAAADGTVFVGAAASSRVHVYEPGGRPLRSWQVQVEGAPFRLALSEGSLQVAPEAAGAVLIYDLEGGLVTRRELAAAYAEMSRPNERAVTTAAGVRYAIEGGRIVRSEGDRHTVLADGFASHAALERSVVAVVVLLLTGASALLGGVLLTASRRRPA